jgi:hypothetical protein
MNTYVPGYTETLENGSWYRRNTGRELNRIWKQIGVNNHDLRPCSAYTAQYYFAEYGTKMRRYQRKDGVVQLDQIMVGAQSANYNDLAPSKMIRKGSMGEAQRRLYGQTLNLAMTAKDLMDANKMACDWFRRMTRAAPYLRKKRFGDAYRAFFGNKSVSKNAANTWLEFQFGVLPTKQAVQEAYTTYANANTPGDSIQINGVPSCLRLSARSQTEFVPNDPGYGWTYPKGSKVVRYQAIRYLSKNDITSALYRFNPFEVGWDMTPWSFVVDWFIPVGDWLKQFGYLTTTHCDGCDTESQLTDVSGVGTFKLGSHGERMEFICSTHDVQVTRRKNASLEYSMSLSEMMSKSKIGLSCKRTVSALSLARQRFGGRGWW